MDEDIIKYKIEKTIDLICHIKHVEKEFNKKIDSNGI